MSTNVHPVNIRLTHRLALEFGVEHFVFRAVQIGVVIYSRDQRDHWTNLIRIDHTFKGWVYRFNMVDYDEQDALVAELRVSFTKTRLGVQV